MWTYGRGPDLNEILWRGYAILLTLILNESKKSIKRNENNKAKFNKRLVRFMKLFFVLYDIFYVRFGVAALNQENCL